jgi:hypothetical protein
MRCCASYRISFPLYQSGLLGRVHNRCLVATACLSKWGAAWVRGQHAWFRPIRDLPGAPLQSPDQAYQEHQVNTQFG